MPKTMSNTLKLERSQMVSCTDITRKFGEYLDRASTKAEPLFILRNNAIEAVMLSVDEYERLAEMEDLVEHLVIARLIQERKNEPAVMDLEELLRTEGISADELREVDPS